MRYNTMNAIKPKILIVDDEPLILKLLSEFLEPTYSVITADSGEKAWQLLTESSHNFSAVITDRMMPDMNGVELTRKIHAQPAFKKTPVIMLTSQAEKE